jgi:hypothetical protein
MRPGVHFSALLISCLALVALAPEGAHAFSGGFWKRRLTAPLWPKGNGGSSGGSGSGSAPSSCNSIGDNDFQACFYDGRNFGQLKASREVGSIGFDWRTGSPDSRVRSDDFSARFSGSFDFDASSYVFSLTSDDGSRLYIDDQLVIDEWNDHGPTTFKATRNLSRGRHRIVVEYYENVGSSLVRLSWSKGTATGGSVAGCSGGLLTDPKAYFYSLIGRSEGQEAKDWVNVLKATGLPTNPPQYAKTDPRVHYGIARQVNSSGEERARLFLPADTADANHYYLHFVDVLTGNCHPVPDSTCRWYWNDWVRDQPAYVPRACP